MATKRRGNQANLNTSNRENDELDQLLTNDRERKNELLELRKAVNLLREELQKKDEVIRDLRDQLDATKQYQRVNNLIIDGLLESNGENTSDLVLQLGEALGVDLDLKDIDISHRLPSSTKRRKHRGLYYIFICAGRKM